jgi:hypothetical protein
VSVQRGLRYGVFTESKNCGARKTAVASYGAIVTTRDVTRTAVAMEQVSKNDFAEMNIRNNRRAVFSVGSVPRVCKNDEEDRFSQLTFDTPACQDLSSGTERV